MNADRNHPDLKNQTSEQASSSQASRPAYARTARPQQTKQPRRVGAAMGREAPRPRKAADAAPVKERSPEEMTEPRAVAERPDAGQVQVKGGVIRHETTVHRVKSGVDRTLLVVVAILLGLGVIMVFSASYAWANYQYGDSFYWVKKHAAWAILGVLAMFATMSFDYRLYKKLAWPIFAVAYLLLAAVPFIGKTVNGAKRWIVIGPIQIQPSEIMKFALELFLAYYMSKYVIAARDIDKALPTEKHPYFKKSFKERFYVFVREVFIPFAIIGLV